MNNFQKLALDDTFRFSCHPGIECFNRCCWDLNQCLTPYDILRLKNGLKLSSGEFLKRYTTHHIGPGSGLPVVTLGPARQCRVRRHCSSPASEASCPPLPEVPAHKLNAVSGVGRRVAGGMLEHENLSCPFVSKAGCMVYPDRPGSCRIYPLARIIQRKPNQHTYEEFHIVIKEPHCLGFNESKEWTVREWKQSQEVSLYNEMNDLLMDIISLKNRSGKKRLSHKENELFYLACYDLDKFRDLVFEKRLWEAHPVEEGVIKSLQEDDVALMRFGIEWIKGRLFAPIESSHQSGKARSR